MNQTATTNHTITKINLLEIDGNVKECQLMISVSTPSLSFEEQVEEVLKAYTLVRHTHQLLPVFKRFFLSDICNQYNPLVNILLDGNDSALSIIEQPPLNGGKVALWAYLMADVETTLLPCGLFEARQGNYRHLWMGNASNNAKDAEHQARINFYDYIRQLIATECTLAANCLRTWLFVRDIDNHYAGVVKARNEVFITQNLTDDTHFIASTGIGGNHFKPNAVTTMDAYAVAGINDSQVHYLYAENNMNRTSDYGVSFERGTYVDYDDRRHVFISGTASISEKGEIMYPNDVMKQCERMLENVEALLKEADCQFKDITSIIVYLRDAADYQCIDKVFRQRFPEQPYLIVNARVCRPGWLIEMECIAAKAL